MPELPETETIARDLDGVLRGAVVRSVAVLRADVLRPDPSPAVLAPVLARAITGVRRRAKAVVIETAEGPRLVVTPRFTGALLLGAPDGDDPYDCLRLALDDGRVLRYRDVRRLGTVAVLDEPAWRGWEGALGPEPLDPALTSGRFSGILRGSRRAVKTILMDQRRLAGVGNIYANESLWVAGLRPTRRGTSVTRREASALLEALRDLLERSIAARGTTFRDYQDAFGGRGGFAAQLRCYGRAGEPCARCGAPLRASHALEGRQTVWCAGCQR